MEKILIYVGGGLLGGLLGFLYWRYVGCASGTCPITSSPLLSTLYGLAFGLLVASGIQPRPAAAKAKLTVDASPASVAAERPSETVSEAEGNKEQTMKTQEKMTTIPLTKSDFLEKVVNYEKEPGGWRYLGDKPALIDFYADWCGPCKRLAPELEALAAEYADQIYIYKVNTEKEQELAAVFGIRSIPTLVFVPMEGQPQVAQGALPRTQLKKLIEEVLLPSNQNLKTDSQ